MPATIWFGLVTYLSTRPGLSLPEFNLFQLDKLGHAGAYAILGWLCMYAWTQLQGHQITLRQGFIVFALASLYGALMEWIQGAFLPGRIFGLDDMVANAFGAALAWGAWTFLSRRGKRQVY